MRIAFLSVGLTWVLCVSGQGDRALWVSYLDTVSRPVLSALAEDRLHDRMPVVLSVRIDNAAERRRVTYLEAFGRTLSGIGPWLNGEGGSAEEVALRRQYREWALKAVANAVNPQAKDYMIWKGGQPLVDAAFFALGLLRCPWLWQHLDTSVRRQVVTVLLETRATTPGYSNWLLFPAVIEAFFCKYGYDYDAMRIEFAVREFSQHWYLGDGTFADGPTMHQDYYNSYVIQPFLLAVLDVTGGRYREFANRMERIAQRYAELQERLIGVDGSYPVTGRSITYRCGAFHALSDVAMRGRLPETLTPGQVRSALTAVIRRTLGAPGTFAKEGWLNIGLAGHQERLADAYITGGSEYLCTEVFLPLGLSATDPFWAAPAAPWTAVKVWGGEDSVDADHALDLGAVTGQDGGWRLVWADEFNVDGPPDAKNWGFEKGFVRNHEAQWYQPENAWCRDGKLVIEARREHKGTGIEYTSASLLTRGLHHFQYGRFEMRAKIDVAPGMWPAFWTLGEKGDWPSNGEIDIMEYYRRTLLANIATGTSRKNSPLWFSKKTPLDSLGGEAWASAFHVWRMDWDERAIVLSVDGKVLLRELTDSLVNRDAGGDVSGTSFPRRFEVDYVRVYQKRSA